MNNKAAADGFFGHPRGLSTLFFTEMWERFSYYGMRAILILFMTAPVARGGLGFDVAHAGTVYGLYTALVYLACLPGGWLADRLIGQRRATFAGGVVIMAGHVALAVPTLASFYLGLALLVVGTGLLKPNISTLVGQLYDDDDSRRDAGYSLYYMGINVGAFMAPLVCGWLAQGEGFRRLLATLGIDPAASWHFGFGAAAIGMALGLLHYLAGRRHLGDVGSTPANVPGGADARRQLARGVLALAVAAMLLGSLAALGVVSVDAAWVGNAFGVILLIITVAFFGWVFGQGDWRPDERRRLVLVLVLFLGATVFWSLYEQGGSTLTTPSAA
ncbi:MAG: oligopeptide:H+ symporter, partial [Gammaproteobacteria bacterium]